MNTRWMKAIEALKANGWKEFTFESEYVGNQVHDMDVKEKYLFHPCVNLTPYENMVFSHGDCDQSLSYDEWDKFLEFCEKRKWLIDL